MEQTKNSRFDYVKYDDLAVTAQAELKQSIQALEATVERHVHSPRAKALVMTKLEEAYMWVGKGIRDDLDHAQRLGSAA
jgi:hypothetical protein